MAATYRVARTIALGLLLVLLVFHSRQTSDGTDTDALQHNDEYHGSRTGSTGEDSQGKSSQAVALGQMDAQVSPVSRDMPGQAFLITSFLSYGRGSAPR